MPTPASHPDLLSALRERLRAAANPARAAGMQAHMKSAMPYHGLPTSPLRQICGELFRGLAWGEASEWDRDVLAIWRAARFREECYAAIFLMGVKAADDFQRASALPLYEEIVVSGAWWDFVDPVATQRLWGLLCADPAAIKPTMRRWSEDADLWKRRCAILCQIKAKENTDLKLLFDCIEPSLGSRAFFLRQAIGWALRQYAWTDPVEVRRFVAAKSDRLSALSRREALKNIGTAA